MSRNDGFDFVDAAAGGEDGVELAENGGRACGHAADEDEGAEVDERSVSVSFSSEVFTPSDPVCAAFGIRAAIALGKPEVVDTDTAAERDGVVGPNLDEDGKHSEGDAADEGGGDAFGHGECGCHVQG